MLRRSSRLAASARTGGYSVIPVRNTLNTNQSITDGNDVAKTLLKRRVIASSSSVLLPNEEHSLRALVKIPSPRPLSLTSLRYVTGSSKLPNIAHLAAVAIWSSPNRVLRLCDIYNAVEAEYPSLRNDMKSKWKASLRHRLSLKCMFIRVGPIQQRGGTYWGLDFSTGLLGNTRPHKRGCGSNRARRIGPEKNNFPCAKELSSLDLITHPDKSVDHIIRLPEDIGSMPLSTYSDVDPFYPSTVQQLLAPSECDNRFCLEPTHDQWHATFDNYTMIPGYAPGYARASADEQLPCGVDSGNQNTIARVGWDVLYD